MLAFAFSLGSRPKGRPADNVARRSPEGPAENAQGDEVRALAADESLVDLRCAVVVVRRSSVLLICRTQHGRGAVDDWVLPGGRPRPHEGMLSCARREVLEETGLRVAPTRCAFVGEVIGPELGPRTVELVFVASVAPDLDASLVGEPGIEPHWVSLEGLRDLTLRPPIAGFLMQGTASTVACLGNLWRADAVPDRPHP